MPALITEPLTDDGVLPDPVGAWTLWRDKDGYERLTGPGGLENILLRRSGRLVGRLALAPLDWPDHGLRQVTWSFVVPSHRGQGHARALYRAAAANHGALLSDHFLSQDAFALWMRLMNDPSFLVDLYLPQKGLVTGIDDPRFCTRELTSDWVYRLRLAHPYLATPGLAPGAVAVETARRI